MSQVIAPPEMLSTPRNQAPRVEAEWPKHEPVPPKQLSAPGLFGSILRGALLLGLGAGAPTFLTFALNPVVVVTVMLLLPALVPIVLVALAILFIEDAQRSKESLADAARQPCSCHRDQLEAAKFVLKK